MSYGIGAFLLAILGRMAIGLISGGVKLLQPSAKKLEARLTANSKNLEKQLIKGFEKMATRARQHLSQ